MNTLPKGIKCQNCGNKIPTTNPKAKWCSDKCRKRFGNSSLKKEDNMRLAVILPDIHHPYHNKSCMTAIFQWLKDYGKQLWAVVLLGDQMDTDAVSHWDEGKTRTLEGKRLKKAYQEFDVDILNPIENCLSKRCKERIFFIGNHEDWVEQCIDRLPNEMEGFAEIETNLLLKERGWKVIPFNGTYQLGKLTLCHGLYTNQYHARKMVDTFGKSVLYGHTHDIQEHTKVTPLDVNDIHKAKSIGCLCDRNQDYNKNRPNKWAHAFSIVYLLPNGYFNEYTVNIVGGRFIWNGKIYGE